MFAKMFGQKWDLALLLLRIGLGLPFLLYGWLHVVDVEGFTRAFDERFGIPFPQLMGPFVAWVEFLGGAATLLGIFTRYAGLLLAITMVVSTLVVRLPAGLAEGRDALGLVGHWDLDLTLFVIGVALMVVGPGRYALEPKLFGREL